MSEIIPYGIPRLHIQEGIEVYLNDFGSISIRKVSVDGFKDKLQEEFFMFELSSLSSLINVLSSLAKEIKEKGVK